MAVPPVAIQSVTPGSDEGSKINIAGKDTAIVRQTFRRTLQHYVTNDNNSSVPNVEHVAGPPPSNYFRQGWCWIPFTAIQAATTAAERDYIALAGKRYRIVEQGFTIKRFQAMQQQVTATGASPTVKNTFVGAPSMMIYKDKEDELYESTYANTQATLETVPIWNLNAGGYTNLGAAGNPPFSAVYARYISNNTTGVEGTLRQVKFGRFGDQEATLPDVQQFNILNGGEVEFLSTGGTYSYSWSAENPQWWSPMAAGGVITTNQIPRIDADAMTQVDQMAIEVARNRNDHPKMHLCRVPPLEDAAGAIILSCELMVEYHVVIEWEPARFLYSRNPGAGLGSLGTVLPIINCPPVDRRDLVNHNTLNQRLLTDMWKVPAERKRKRIYAEVDQDGPIEL